MGLGEANRNSTHNGRGTRLPSIRGYVRTYLKAEIAVDPPNVEDATRGYEMFVRLAS